MADVGDNSCTFLGTLNEDKELEDGEIDDTEEGEITDDIPAIQEYNCAPREAVSPAQNERQGGARIDTYQKSRHLNREVHERNGGSRKPGYSHHNDERWMGSPFSRNYENMPRNYENFERERAGSKMDERNSASPNIEMSQWYDTNRNLRMPPGQFNRRPSFHPNFNAYPTSINEKYPPQKPKTHKPPSTLPRHGSNEDLPDGGGDDDDYEFLLERYKRIQEQLDELGPGAETSRSLVDDLIDDTFVDIPLDDIPNAGQGKGKMNEDGVKLDFDEANSENYSGTTEGNDVTDMYHSNSFSPFAIKTQTKKVRTLSELNEIDLVSRGLDRQLDERTRSSEIKSEQNEERSKIIQRQASTGKTKKKRRRPYKYARLKKRAELSRNQSGNRRSSSDTYEKLGIALNKKGQSTGSRNNREKRKMIMRRKEQLKAWHEKQELEKSKQTGANLESTLDDYLEKPMDVDSDSTEGGSKIEELHPPLPLVEITPPPPPAMNVESTQKTPHLMPLMALTPHDGHGSYSSHWIESDLARQLTPPENTVEDNAVEEFSEKQESTEDVREEEEDDDEASVRALREQLLKSMANKRAAKSSSKDNESKVALKHDGLVPTDDVLNAESRAESPAESRADKTSVKTASLPKLTIPPPKHEPVVIRLGEDSDDSIDSAGDSPRKNSFGSIFGGLDDLIKAARQRASKPKVRLPEEKSPKPREPTTPDALSVLSKEKRTEYKRLKEQLAIRQQQQLKKGQGKEDHLKEKEGPLHKSQQKQTQPFKKPPNQQELQKTEQHRLQRMQQNVLLQEKAKATKSHKASTNVNQSEEELMKQVKSFDEKLMEQKKLINQDKKLLENTKNQLNESSMALEEHEARVSVLRQQLQRSERLKAVQKDLVNKLQVQNIRLTQRMTTRQSTAREMEESLLRGRALLVARKAQRSKVVGHGRRPPGDVKQTALNPGQSGGDNLQPSGKSLEEVRERISKLSQSLEQSISLKRKKMNDAGKLQKVNEDSPGGNNRGSSRVTLKSSILTEDKLALEKIRLKKLEEELSKRLRESNARSNLPKNTAALLSKVVGRDEERASSDSELLVKRSAPRGLSPNVELASVNAGGVVNAGSGDSKETDTVWGIFRNLEELGKLRKIQAERELKGPSFSDVEKKIALPVQFSSTQCIWLNVEDVLSSEQLSSIRGCSSTLTVPAPTEVKCERAVREEWTFSAPGPYKSPLLHFRSYRFSPYYRTKKGLALDSLTFSHLINPRRPFCSFALHGICSDPECTQQHMNDIVPKDDQVLEDLAAYFPPAYDKASGEEGLEMAVRSSVETVTKQYEGKVSQAELRVLFVNQLKKQKAKGIYNVALEQRPWWPCSYRRKNPGNDPSPEEGSEGILTQRTFSWKNWKRKIKTEMNTRLTTGDDCQEIRYFSENYDSIKTLENATVENPGDETLWIRLALLHAGSNRTSGDSSDTKGNLDRALNVLAQALEGNRHSKKLWLKYLELFRTRRCTDEIYEVCEEAVDMAPSYDVWWTYLDIASGYGRKVDICIRLLEFLLTADLKKEVKSHQLLEAFLYLVQLDKFCGYHSLASTRFQAALLSPVSKGWHKTVAALVVHLACADLCLMWMCYIHLVEFSHLPRNLFDPACSEPARIVSKDEFVFPWKPDGGTSQPASRLLKLFHGALKACSARSDAENKVPSSLPLYKNLVALERACGKTESAIRSCQRLLKASTKEVDLWLCLASLEQLSDRGANVSKVYKNALENCGGHAQVAYSAAKHFFKKNNLKECYEALAYCVNSKFILDLSNEGPRTRAKSRRKPITKPDPFLLYRKLLSQAVPPGTPLPPFQPGHPANLGSELTYIWLCYCVFVELFPCTGAEQRRKMVQEGYETAIHSTGERKQVKLLWTEYLHYMSRRLKEKQCSADEMNDIFHRCLITVLAVTPLLYVGSKSWADYHFHNEVFSLYRTCLGDSFSLNIYDKYLELFPDNCQMAIQAVECACENNQVEKSRKILSTALLKTPYNILLWKIAISIELKERNIDQAKQLYEHATEVLPLAATLWKDFALFQLAHDSTTEEKAHPINKILRTTKENGINLEDFLRTLLSK